MKTKYEFRKKALEFAKKQEYDMITYKGIYQNYEVYMPYCKSWKDNPPVIGLPRLILVNGDEVKLNGKLDPFEILEGCKKLPSVVF